MPAPRKGFIIRAIAFAIDLAIGAVLFVVLFLIVAAIYPKFADSEGRVITGFWWAVFIVVMFVEVLFAQTIGKAILRMSVANADCTPAATSTLVSRWLTKSWPAWLFILDAAAPNPAVVYIASVGSGAMILSFLSVINEGKQGWHDQVTGTAVFRRIDVDGPDDSPGGFAVVTKNDEGRNQNNETNPNDE